MPALLKAVYERLRDAGAYDTDWVDQAAWWIFTVFVLLLVAVG